MQSSQAFRSPKMKRFCELFAQLFHQERAAGIARPKVGRRAALMAGYGSGSWNENRVIQTADTMYAKLVSRDDVTAYLRQLGVVRLGRQWVAVGEVGHG